MQDEIAPWNHPLRVCVTEFHGVNMERRAKRKKLKGGEIEGLPIALLEAMSYGLSVLVSDIPANLENTISDNYWPRMSPEE